LPPLNFAVGGAMPMPHARLNGTAWDKTLNDYSYTRELDLPSIAWEFLRRNEALQCDARASVTAQPIPIRHVSGACYLRCRRRFLTAEKWGLQFFPDPQKSALKTNVFWCPTALSLHIRARLSPQSEEFNQTIALDDFTCQRTILCQQDIEHVLIRHGPECVRLTAHGLSILHGRRTSTFEIDGFRNIAPALRSLQRLSRLAAIGGEFQPSTLSHTSKWKDCLIALDGHLAKRSYRDIAIVLFGRDRVGTHWTGDTQWMKSTIRRAVKRGVDLMEGGYRELL
jgi:hypothetical protein